MDDRELLVWPVVPGGVATTWHLLYANALGCSRERAAWARGAGGTTITITAYPGGSIGGVISSARAAEIGRKIAGECRVATLPRPSFRTAGEAATAAADGTGCMQWVGDRWLVRPHVRGAERCASCCSPLDADGRSRRGILRWGADVWLAEQTSNAPPPAVGLLRSVQCRLFGHPGATWSAGAKWCTRCGVHLGPIEPSKPWPRCSTVAPADSEAASRREGE